MTFKKVTYIIGLVLLTITIISFFISLYDYNSTYNIWAEEEDSLTRAIIPVAVILIFVAIFMIIMIPATKKVKTITNGKVPSKPTPNIIKKNSAYSIKSSAFEIILFLIISEEAVYKFGIRTLDMNLAEAEFLAGGYQIFKNHFLFIAIITLIQSLIDYFSAERQFDSIDDSNNYNDKQMLDDEFKAETYLEETSHIKCPSCGFEQPKGRKVCWKCNMKFANVEAVRDNISKCPNCGIRITEEMLFCGNCGNKIKEK